METPQERAAFYRRQAMEIRAVADKVVDPTRKRELLDIARQFARLAERALKSSY
jgi:hypothetical protein